MRISFLIILCISLTILIVTGQKSKKKGKISDRNIQRQPQKQQKAENIKSSIKAKNKGKDSSNRKMKQKKGRNTKKKQKTNKQGLGREIKKIKNIKKNNRPAGGINDGNRQSAASWDSCSTTTLNDTCLENALSVLEFEKNQIQNFFKQKSRAASQSKISGNKEAKKDDFANAASLVLTALGGNISTAECGSSNETRGTEREKNAAIDSYTFLLNCSNSIAEACTIPNDTYNDDIKQFHASCEIVYNKIKEISTDCRTNDTFRADAQKACACWAAASDGVQEAKKQGCIAARDTAKAVKKQKGLCIDAFSACKTAEDEAIALITACSSGDIISEDEAAKGSVDSKYLG